MSARFHPLAVNPETLLRCGCSVPVLAPVKPAEPKPPRKIPSVVENAIEAICQHCKVSREDLLEHTRSVEGTRARLLLYWVCVRLFDLKAYEACRYLGRGELTVKVGVKSFERQMGEDPKTAKQAERFRRLLQPKSKAQR